MNATEIKNKASELIAKSGNQCNAARLDEIAAAGFAGVADGSTIYSAGNQVVTLKDGAAVCTINGAEVKRTAITTDAMRDSITVQYAVTEATIRVKH